ncbi:hypothetical protein E4G67_03690 [Candidatus Bathyarchaeota archaeon]|nr:MAG: hypothetical protein E4G67_03690 [Candidatus Bathyarchaeota archaeon]
MFDNTETPVEDTSVAQESEATETPDYDELDLTIDEIIKLNSQDFEEFTDDAQHKGMKPLAHWMQHVPPDVRKHIANLRADYSRKTQTLSNERKEIERLREELTNTKSGVLDGPLTKIVAAVDMEAEHDIFDPEGMKAEIQRQAALMLQSMLKPAQEQVQAEQRKMALERFKAENPELTQPEYRAPILQMLQERPELKLEDAFYIVKAKIDSTKISEERARLSQQKTDRASTLQKIGGGSAASPKGTPKFKSAWDAYQYHKQMGDVRK